LIYCYSFLIVAADKFTSKELSLRPLHVFFAVLSALMPVCVSAPCQQGTPLNPPMAPASRPFSPGIQVGETVYLSGHLGLDPATGQAPGDPAEEARQVMRSIGATLKQAGMTMDDLVSVEIYCTDLSLYSLFNKEYVTFFNKPYPARDFIGVKDLLFGAHFEVMGTAVRHAAAHKKQPAVAP
jgi:2-iminobutanoate/2-iminopropanoate deaminase